MTSSMALSMPGTFASRASASGPCREVCTVPSLENETTTTLLPGFSFARVPASAPSMHETSWRSTRCHCRCSLLVQLQSLEACKKARGQHAEEVREARLSDLKWSTYSDSSSAARASTAGPRSAWVCIIGSDVDMLTSVFEPGTLVEH